MDCDSDCRAIIITTPFVRGMKLINNAGLK